MAETERYPVDVDVMFAPQRVHPEPTDVVQTGSWHLYRFLVRDGETISLEGGRQAVKVRIKPRVGAANV